jgi:hypothetical protein
VLHADLREDAVPVYTYTGDEPRYYPTLGLTAIRGATVDLDANPDPARFDPPDDPDGDLPVPGAPFGPLPAAITSPSKEK